MTGTAALAPQVTRIFLGSSEELRADRLALANFMNGVNNAYVAHGKRFLLVEWEHESIALARHAEGKQAEYNELVRAADVCLFLFHTRCGAYTLQEVDAALGERSRTGGRPRILTWVRRLGPGEERSPELADLCGRVDCGELDLPYQVYSDIREVALDLLAQLAPYGADIAPQRIGDFVYLEGEPLVDLG